MTDTDIASRLDRVERELDELRSIEEIRVLRHRYHEYVNESRYSEIPSLFSADGSLDFDYLGKAATPDKVVKFFGNADGLLQFVKQFIHAHTVMLDGDQGTGVSYMEARTVSDGEPFLVAGKYDDTYVRTDAGWRFQHMQFRFVYSVPFSDPQAWAAPERLRMGYSPASDS